MGVEQKPGSLLERNVWRGTGVALALEAVRLIATLPQPKTEARALEIMGLGLLVPMWAIWGEGRGGWFTKDLSSLPNLVTRKKE